MSVYCPILDSNTVYMTCNECDKKWCESFFCMVIGSRTFKDYNLMCEKLDNLLKNHKNVVIVSGGASGADSLAERYAKERGFELKVFPAEWNKFGNAAGYIRNRQMHEFIAKQDKRGVVAFWDGKSKGTVHSFELAKTYNNPIRIIRFNEVA